MITGTPACLAPPANLLRLRAPGPRCPLSPASQSPAPRTLTRPPPPSLCLRPLFRERLALLIGHGRKKGIEAQGLGGGAGGSPSVLGSALHMKALEAQEGASSPLCPPRAGDPTGSRPLHPEPRGGNSPSVENYFSAFRDPPLSLPKLPHSHQGQPTMTLVPEMEGEVVPQPQDTRGSAPVWRLGCRGKQGLPGEPPTRPVSASHPAPSPEKPQPAAMAGGHPN